MKRIVVRMLIALFLAVAIIVAAKAQNQQVAKVHIPFEFFADGERMPAGDYTLSPMSSGMLLFHNEKTGTAKRVFTTRSGDSVPAGDARLVFALLHGQYRFAGLRGITGTYRVSAYYYSKLPEGASLHEIPVLYGAATNGSTSHD